jgi:hypothetical protein
MADIAGFGILVHIVARLLFIGGKHNLPFFIENPYHLDAGLVPDTLDHAVYPLPVGDQHIVPRTPGNGIAKDTGTAVDLGNQLFILVRDENIGENPEDQDRYQTDGND